MTLILINFYVNLSSQSRVELDSAYRVSFADKLIIKANVSTANDTYIVKESKDLKLKIVPNDNYRLSLSVDYEIFGISFGFSPDFFTKNQDEYLKGKSSFSDFQFRAFLGKWVQGIYHKKITGYYIENTQDYIDDWIKGLDPYLQLPNLENVTWGMSTSYVFNPKFSIRNVFYQTEWQKQSAGSFVPMLFYDFNKYSFDVQGINAEEKLFNIRLAANYYYTFVIHQNWFIGTNISPSLSLRFSNSTNYVNNIKSSENNTIIYKQLDGGLQLGYSSKKLIMGCNFNFSTNWFSKNKNTITENEQIYGVLYLGYRFNTPKFISKTYDWFENKLGF